MDIADIVGSLKRGIDKSLELYDRGCQDAETTALDIVHAVVTEAVEDERALSVISYFLEVAPKEMVRAGAERVTRLKNDTDFMIPPFCCSPNDLPPEELRSLTLKRRAKYFEIYDILKREAARQDDESAELRPERQ